MSGKTEQDPADELIANVPSASTRSGPGMLKILLWLLAAFVIGATLLDCLEILS